MKTTKIILIRLCFTWECVYCCWTQWENSQDRREPLVNVPGPFHSLQRADIGNVSRYVTREITVCHQRGLLYFCGTMSSYYLQTGPWNQWSGPSPTTKQGPPTPHRYICIILNIVIHRTGKVPPTSRSGDSFYFHYHHPDSCCFSTSQVRFRWVMDSKWQT